MKPRRLHNDTIRSIGKVSFGSAIGLVSVRESRPEINPERQRK
jgi:hypothetical protein